ncbi:MAG: glycosyl hydrolase [Rhodospirillales bacterium]|nr:glycosyl hydrolase [Alphaproteobacteria bacterium]MCB9981433.1 glycosyl hydrolase [Rhodospirillales bacterium]
MKPSSTLLIFISIFTFFAFMAQAQQTISGVPAKSAADFLNSLGINTHVAQGYNPKNYIEPLKYTGIRNIRDASKNLSGYFMLHKETGVRVDLLGSKLHELIPAAQTLAKHGVLMAVEGPNEPNNWPITYKGEKGGGKGSWKAVAQFQRDLYHTVKSDPLLKDYPVFHISEGGAQTDNVGLQFLTIPEGAGTLMPAGTIYADYANAHNYVSGNGGRHVDNQAWNAADPMLDSFWDGLYGNYGRTWRKKYKGYSNEELMRLPRVSTETGWATKKGVSEERTQGVMLVNTYLAQFKRGWAYTFVYQLGEAQGSKGLQGIYRKDWTPKAAAHYIHNLTSILADTGAGSSKPGSLAYRIYNQPDTVHDLLLQKSDGRFFLVVWGEKVKGDNDIVIQLAEPAAKIKIFDVTAGSEPQKTLSDALEIPLTLNDHALILEFH